MSAKTAGGSLQYAQAGVFTVEEDLTLRGVTFYGQAAILTTDPAFSDWEGTQQQRDFQILGDIAIYGDAFKLTQVKDLAFPCPKGTKLYWGIVGPTDVNQRIQLFFS
jgi:hypothetical protein